jgi:hypothetical protein
VEMLTQTYVVCRSCVGSVGGEVPLDAWRRSLFLQLKRQAWVALAVNLVMPDSMPLAWKR